MQTCTAHFRDKRTIICVCISGLKTAPNLFYSGGASAAKGIGPFTNPLKCCKYAVLLSANVGSKPQLQLSTAIRRATTHIVDFCYSHLLQLQVHCMLQLIFCMSFDLMDSEPWAWAERCLGAKTVGRHSAGVALCTPADLAPVNDRRDCALPLQGCVLAECCVVMWRLGCPVFGGAMRIVHHSGAST
jgi:hypothetical protein